MATRRKKKIASVPVVAKLAAPRLAAVHPRTRLFKLLDRGRRKAPIVWIEGPAGSGKTTLAAHYIERRRLKCLWYDLDVRDADPATFFYYLRAGLARLAPRKRETLPLLTPEYALGLPAFVRNFFEQGFARLGRGAVLVLDGYQDLPATAPLHSLLPEALDIVPEGVTILILSREGPPAAFARLQARQALSVIKAEGLTLAEARAIARLHGAPRLAAKTLARLHARLEGWAAGWVLLLERAREGEFEEAQVPLLAREALFDYFATELFERVAPAAQDLLMKCALPPQISPAMAQSLTGQDDAARILADLVRRNYFTTRLAGPAPQYRFHPLFREFLIEHGRARFSVEERRRLCREAAALLVAAQPDQAVGLLREAADVSGLIGLIETHAPALAAQGRLATLHDWLGLLLPEAVASRPWLSYWLGVCRMLFDLPEARAHLERAYAGFHEARDAAGLYLAWAGIVETFFHQWDDYAPLDRWLDELDALRLAYPLDRCPPAQPRVIYAALSALGFLGTGRPELSVWVQAAETLLATLRDPNLRVLLAAALCLHYVWIGDLEKLDAIAAQLRAQLASAEPTPVAHFHGYFALAMHGWVTGDLAQGEHWLRTGFAYGERQGIGMFEPLLCGQALYLYEVKGDQEAVARTLERMRQALDPRRRLDLAHYRYHATWLALTQGEVRRARDLAEQSLALAESLFARFPIALNHIRFAEVLVELAELAGAHRQLDAAEAIAERMGSQLLRFVAGLVRAHALHRAAAGEESDRALAAAFAIGRRMAFTTYPGWNARIVAALCAHALARGIEPDYARRLVRERKLTPPDNAPAEQWPFPVKVYCLGGFRVLLEDKVLAFAGKAQKKALDLLKALVALGGLEVTEHRLADALWPDSDAARQNLKSTLHRLRKLVGAHALVLSEGKLSLDPRICWVDIWAFERALGDAAEDPAKLLAALPLYKGSFLSGEDDAYLISARERLKARFLRAAVKAGAHLESQGRFEQAVDLYDSALRHDELAEVFYQRIMRCYQRLGRAAEALAVYARCAQALGACLGLGPNAETEALRGTLLSQSR